MHAAGKDRCFFQDDRVGKRFKSKDGRRRIPKEFLQSTNTMTELLSGTVTTEQKMADKLCKEIDRARDQLPVEFLVVRPVI